MAEGESARRRLHRRGARLPPWLAPANEGGVRVELVVPGTPGLTVGMGQGSSGRDTRRGRAQRSEALPTDAVASIDARHLLMPKTSEPAHGSLLSWQAYLGSLSVGTAVRPADDGWGLLSGFIVSALLGAALLLLLSLLRHARARWTHHSARAHWAVEGAAAVRLHSRARSRPNRERERERKRERNPSPHPNPRRCCSAGCAGGSRGAVCARRWRRARRSTRARAYAPCCSASTRPKGVVSSGVSGSSGVPGGASMARGGAAVRPTAFQASKGSG